MSKSGKNLKPKKPKPRIVELDEGEEEPIRELWQFPQRSGASAIIPKNKTAGGVPGKDEDLYESVGPVASNSTSYCGWKCLNRRAKSASAKRRSSNLGVASSTPGKVPANAQSPAQTKDDSGLPKTGTSSPPKIKGSIPSGNDQENTKGKRRLSRRRNLPKADVSDLTIHSVPQEQRAASISPLSTCQATTKVGETPEHTNLTEEELTELLSVIHQMRWQCTRLEAVIRLEAFRIGCKIDTPVMAADIEEMYDSELSQLGSLDRDGSWWVFPRHSQPSLASDSESNTEYDEVRPMKRNAPNE